MISITDGPREMIMLTELSFLLWFALSATTDGDVFLIRLSFFYEDQLVPPLSIFAGGGDAEGQASGRRKAEGEKERDQGVDGRSGGSVVWCVI